jgi:branched-chain amino acid transport system substrate-binding protein
MDRRRVFLIIGLVAAAFAAVAVVRLAYRRGDDQRNVIKVGAILPQTGPGAVFAQYIKEGIDLAAGEINERGEPGIRVLYEDSKNQPREAVAVYNKLVSTEGPPVVIVALSSVAKALAPLAEPSGTAQVYVAVAIPDITDGKYTFRVYPEAVGMAGVIARHNYNSKSLNARTSAVIYVNDDFGRVSLDAYVDKFKHLGGSVIYSESYELQQTDFRAQIAKLKSLSPAPDVIYLSGYGPSYVAIIRQLREQDVQIPLTADMTMGLPDTLEQVGGAAEGVFYVDGKMSDDFRDRFKSRYHKEASSYAGYAYDITHLIHWAAAGRGVRDFNADAVREGLLAVRDHPGAMGNISIRREDGDSNLQFIVKHIEGGVAKPVPE